MLTPDLFRVAATGILEPAAIADLAGMSVDELLTRHGAEIAAAQAAVRGQAVATILALGLDDPQGLITALEADDVAWPGPASRTQSVLKVIAFALSARHGRQVAAGARLLALPDAFWREVGDNRALLRRHLERILRDPAARPGLRRQAGRALLKAERARG
jgi:hypothetical protein